MHRSLLAFVLVAVAALVSGVAYARDLPVDSPFGAVHGGRFAMMREAGILWSRGDFWWQGLEPEKGHFRWEGLDRIVNEASENGVGLLPILDYNNPWSSPYAPVTDRERADFCDYVRAVVSRYKDRIGYWQVWNEPNIGFWKPEPNPEHYTRLLKDVHRTIKSIDPEAQVVFGGTSGVDLEFIRKVYELGGGPFFDILAVHPYREAPEIRFLEDLAALKALMREFGPEKPIWATEIGWASTRGLGERIQAEYLVRAYVLCLAAGVQRAFYYSLSGGEGSGIVTEYFRPKPAYYAYKTMAHLLGGARYAGSLAQGDGVYAYAFLKGEEAIAVLWSAAGPKTVSLPVGRPTVTIADLRGRRRSLACPDNVATLTLDSAPVYLLDADPFVLLAHANLEIRPHEALLSPGASLEVQVLVGNTSPASRRPWRVGLSSVQDTVSLDLPAIPFSVQPGETVEFGARVHAPEGAQPGHYRIEVRLVSDPEGHSVAGSRTAAARTLDVVIQPPRLWEYETGGRVYSSPTLFDLDGDGGEECLINSQDDGRLLCLDGKGALRWSYQAERHLSSTPSVGDVDADGKPEVLQAFRDVPLLACVGADGQEKWKVNTGAKVRWSCPALADLDGKPGLEIVLGGEDGKLHCLNGAGTSLWTFEAGASTDLPPAVADVNQDNATEIVFADGEGTVRCLSAEGGLLWTYALRRESGAGPIIADLSLASPGLEVVAATQTGQVYCLSSEGKLLWRRSLGAPMDATLAAADLDRDGHLEVLCADVLGGVHCFDGEGRLRWRFFSAAAVDSAPVASDVDGDGLMEVLFGSADYCLYCLDAGGRLKWKHFAGSKIGGSPGVGEMAGDGRAFIVAGTKGERVVCLSVGNLSKVPGAWLTGRGNPQQTGASLYQLPPQFSLFQQPYRAEFRSQGIFEGPSRTGQHLRVEAHRGRNAYAPENTAAAIEQAIAIGCDLVEVDVQTSADGRLVISHDDTVERRTNGAGEIERMSWPELARLEAGSWFGPRFACSRLPTLGEVLAQCRGRIGVYVDAKSVAPEELVRALREHGMMDQVIVHHGAEYLAELRALAPKVATIPSFDTVADIERLAATLKPEFVEAKWGEMTEATVAAARRLGMEFSLSILGGGDTLEGWSQSLDLGIDMIETDHPDELIALVRERK